MNDRYKHLNFTPLNKQKKKRNKLVGSFAEIPFTNRSWFDRALPEVLWVALLRNIYALQTFTDVLKPILNEFEYQGINSIELTNLGSIEHDKAERIINFICSTREHRIALRPLLLFEDLPQYNLWKAAINEEPDYQADGEALGLTIHKTLDHQSQEATDCRWAKCYIGMISNKITFIHRSSTPYDILDYPDVADMRKTRPSIRSMEIAFDMGVQHSDWADSFWEGCFESTECFVNDYGAPHEERFTTQDTADFIRHERRKLFLLRNIIGSYKKDIKLDIAVGTGLFAVKILDELLDNEASRTGILGRLALRTLTEVSINISYLRSAPEEVWASFRNHGTGEAKKVLLKLMNTGVQFTFVDIDDIFLQANEDRWMEFNSINLGDWEDANLRDRAIKADEKDIYDTFYDWPSHYTHGQWGAIRREVFMVCTNPLHRFHLLPNVEGERSYADVLLDATRLTKWILHDVYAIYPELHPPMLLGSGEQSHG
ncbi:hypothetical protein HJC99_03315 [Candidatus Saccharibacteria bacterium]|nr:hypothetical protein [Candidatus Saccharibacteria bacterium]